MTVQRPISLRTAAWICQSLRWVVQIHRISNTARPPTGGPAVGRRRWRRPTAGPPAGTSTDTRSSSIRIKRDLDADWYPRALLTNKLQRLAPSTSSYHYNVALISAQWYLMNIVSLLLVSDTGLSTHNDSFSYQSFTWEAVWCLLGRSQELGMNMTSETVSYGWGIGHVAWLLRFILRSLIAWVLINL